MACCPETALIAIYNIMPSMCAQSVCIIHAFPFSTPFLTQKVIKQDGQEKHIHTVQENKALQCSYHPTTAMARNDIQLQVQVSLRRRNQMYKPNPFFLAEAEKGLRQLLRFSA